MPDWRIELLRRWHSGKDEQIMDHIACNLILTIPKKLFDENHRFRRRLPVNARQESDRRRKPGPAIDLNSNARPNVQASLRLAEECK